ncbi:MAG: hypothetical protein NTU49_03165 [Gammaproteobacteria bacterium]|nr:hypothetical protein [Gammaproteobacteria bacterium]
MSRNIPQWVDALFTQESEITQNVEIAQKAISTLSSTNGDAEELGSTANLNLKKLKQFIANNFMEIKAGENSNSYHNKKFEITLTTEKMQALIRVMTDAHYDGEMHTSSYEITEENSWEKYGLSVVKTLSQNILVPTALLFQLLNLLECTAILTAIWEKKPEYKPDGFIYAALTVMGAATLRSNHLYSTVKGNVSKADIEAAHNEVITLQTKLKTSLKIDDQSAEKLTRLTTLPSTTMRTEQEVRCYISYAIKLSASFAILSEEFPNYPLFAITLAALLAGSVEGIDTAFNQVLAISSEHQSAMEFLRGRIPVANSTDRAFSFAYLANFAPVPWMMAKLGPALWAFVKFRAALTLMTLFNIDKSDVYGGLIGYQSVMLMSALTFSSVFSLYNVDHKLGEELPTKRDFKPTQAAEALVSALPIAAIVAYITHLASEKELMSLYPGVAAAVSLLPTIALILKSDTFSEKYRYFAEMRFVPDILTRLDALPVLDKAIITAAGFVTTGLGMWKDEQWVAGPGQALLFMGLMGLIAERSRIAANMTRFIPIQMALYAAALTTWILNCAMPFINLLRDRDPQDHPKKLDDLYLFLICFAGALAGYKDFCSTASKVDKLVEPIANENRREKSYAKSVCSFLSETARSLCGSKDTVVDAADPKQPLFSHA